MFDTFLRLCFRGGPWWKKYKLHSFEIIDFWMGEIIVGIDSKFQTINFRIYETIIYNDSKFLTFSFKLSIKLLYLSIKKKAIHPTFCLCSIMTRKTFEIIESSRLHWFLITKIGIFPVRAFAAVIPVNQTFLCLPPQYLSPSHEGFSSGGFGSASPIHQNYMYLWAHIVIAF